jgi:pyrophosphatase PpaX
MTPTYGTVLFDLDGTLLDTIGLIKASMRHALRTHLGWEPDDAALVRGVGTPLIEQVRHHGRVAAGRALDEVLVSRIAQTYIDHNLAGHDATVAPYPGVADTLARLQARGVRLGIVTSKPNATARRGLRVCGLEGCFDLVVGMDDVARHKPDPEPVRFALDRLGVPAADALFVGDSPHDMLAGRAAGVHTGAAMWGPFSRADLDPTTPVHYLDHITAIEPLVR